MKDLFSQDRNPNADLSSLRNPCRPSRSLRSRWPTASCCGTVFLPPSFSARKPDGPQKGYHPGDTIGPWTLVSVDNSYADFEWDGKEFKKRIDELIDRTPIAQAGAAGEAAPAPSSGGSNPVRSLATR